ncbi:unnamed protein product [Caenorhabditis nigoni]
MKTVIATFLITIIALAQGSFLKDCTNASDGLYAIGACEPQFLTCSGGIARVMDCPADLAYHESEEICDWKHNIAGCRVETERSGEEYASGGSSGDASGDDSEDASGDASGDGSGSVSEEESGSEIETSGDEVLENVCEYREDGVYTSEVCASAYFICTSNSPRFLVCTTPLYYDSNGQKCNWVDSIKECGKGPTTTTTVEEITSGYRVYGEESSGEEEGSGLWSQSCDGVADGIYPISECSTNFLTCSGGIPRVMDCPSSLFFNPSLQVCDWQRNVVGCSGVEAPRPTCEQNGYFSYGKCSSSFTACTNGRAIVMFCPSGLKFSQSTQMCDYERNVSECDVESSGEPLEEESSGYSGYGEPDSKLTPCVNMENGLYALECTPRVLSCQDGKEEIFECPSNLVFNEKSLICDYPETSQKCQLEETLLIRDAPMATYDCEVDGLFSNALCSREYHKCSDGQLIKYQCAEPNSVFSAVDGECVDFSTLSQCH